MRIKIALALISAVFLMFWFPFVGYVLRPSPDIIELLSIISFLGSVLFLLEARKVLPRWHLAVPLCVSLAALVVVNFFIIFSGKGFLKDPINSAEKLMITLMMLLPLFSAFVFLSLLRHPDSMNAYASVSYGINILSLVISCVLSFITMLFLGDILRYMSATSESLVFVGIYWLFGMPIIGIFFLLSALTYRNPKNILSQIKGIPTQKSSSDYTPFVDNFMRIKIALALTSAIFLTMWIALAFKIPFSVIILLNIISLLGSILFLLEARDTVHRWHLAVPLCISLSVLTMLDILIYVGGGLPGSGLILERLWIILLALLPPCSAMVFLSLKGRSGSIDTYIAVSSAMSILSIISLFFAYRGISKWSTIFSLITAWDISWSTIGSAQFPMIFYWTVLMPIIGICFLVRAITYMNPENTLISVTVGLTKK